MTNDAWTPLRAGRRYQAPKPQRGAAAPLLPPAVGRDHRDAGTLVAHRPALPGPTRSRARSRSCCSSARGSSRATASAAKGIPGGYGAVYGELRALETLGVCRRGYFVEGLGGAQFALPGAVERLRELRPREGERAGAARARRRRSGAAVRRGAAVAEARRRARRARRRRAGRAARRRGGAVRRARRPLARPAPRARGRAGSASRSPRSSST